MPRLTGDARRLVLLGAVAAALAVLAWRLPIVAWLTGFAGTLQGAGARGVALFFAAYIVATVAFLPGSVLTLVAGFAYGPLWGLAVASPASVAGATSAFLLGRTLLFPVVCRRIQAWPRAEAIRGALEREGFRIVLLLRLSPVVPFNLLNYLLGVTRIRLVQYVGASFLGMLPATAFYAYAGSLASTAVEVASGTGELGTGRVILSLAGIAATLLALVIVTRTARRALATALPEDG